MPKPVGGRGKKAPYQTKTIRIPVDLENQIEQLIEQYRHQAVTGETIAQDGPLPFDDAVALAAKLLKAKKSKLETVTKLVTGIYNKENDVLNLSQP